MWWNSSWALLHRNSEREVDTGSDLSWVQCSPCYFCFSQPDALFKPNASRTSSDVTRTDSLCQVCNLLHTNLIISCFGTNLLRITRHESLSGVQVYFVNSVVIWIGYYIARWLQQSGYTMLLWSYVWWWIRYVWPFSLYHFRRLGCAACGIWVCCPVQMDFREYGRIGAGTSLTAIAAKPFNCDNLLVLLSGLVFKFVFWLDFQSNHFRRRTGEFRS